MKPELLAPAGDMVSLRAAIQGGADAVYFGVSGLNMRARARNFSMEDILEVTALCHEAGVKAYLALNSILFDEELQNVRSVLEQAKIAGIDAVILWDFAALAIARELGLPIHLSTQASASNTFAVREYGKLGVARVVLARECSLARMETIARDSGIEIEAFCHGALCVAVSGRCLTSQFLFGKSANRGECLQPCRREYTITDPEEGSQLVLDDGFVLSPKDLCTVHFLDRLIATGVSSLKIEGRNRKPEYVLAVTKAYREAIDLNHLGALTAEKKKELIASLCTVYNRGFSSGFYLGEPSPEDFCSSYGSVSSHSKEHVGKVVNFFRKPMAAEILVQSVGLKRGDRIMIQGPTTGVRESTIIEMQMENKDVLSAEKGSSVAVRTGFTCRKNDQVFLFNARNAP